MDAFTCSTYVLGTCLWANDTYTLKGLHWSSTTKMFAPFKNHIYLHSGIFFYCGVILQTKKAKLPRRGFNCIKKETLRKNEQTRHLVCGFNKKNSLVFFISCVCSLKKQIKTRWVCLQKE